MTAVKYGALFTTTSALLGLLQATTQCIRRLVGAPAVFSRKLTACCCREGVFEWVLDMETALAASSRKPLLLLRRKIWEPIITLAAGSSICEEAVFRGLILHALLVRAKMNPVLASVLSSALFGLSHIGNEYSLLQRSIYAGWTFFGGLIFGAAYLGTRGGLVMPILLHFFNNAIVFGVSVQQVGDKMLAERQMYQKIQSRVAASRNRNQGIHPEVQLQLTRLKLEDIQ